MLTDRGLISLSQFVAVQNQETVLVMLQKCGIVGVQISEGPTTVKEVLIWLRAVSPSQVEELVGEICHSTRMLRAAVSPKYIYDERWTDLGRCLLLDGYHVTGDYSTGYSVVTVDPTIAASAPLDDDLSNELNRSDLAERDEIIRLMKNSAEDFRRQPQDFNGSLTSARVSLETLAKNIASIHQTTTPMSGDPTKFGAIVAYLRHQIGFLDEKEEKGITGVYSFVSPGAHVPVGFTEEEMVRLGRSMIAAMCYFLVKKYNR
jgi:hypothetical protein